MRKTIGLS